MGAWGSKAFENDAALDWLAELERDDLAAIHEILSRVASSSPKQEVDLDDASAAIAAAEIVAAKRHGTARLSPDAKAWHAANASSIEDDDLVLARHAVARLLTGPCELRALWEESGADSDWHVDVRALLAILGGDPAKLPAPSPREDTVSDHHKQGLFTFLAMRGLEPDDQQSARIEACQDPAEMRRWLSRVVTAKSVAEMLDD